MSALRGTPAALAAYSLTLGRTADFWGGSRGRRTGPLRGAEPFKGLRLELKEIHMSGDDTGPLPGAIAGAETPRSPNEGGGSPPSNNEARSSKERPRSRNETRPLSDEIAPPPSIWSWFSPPSRAYSQRQAYNYARSRHLWRVYDAARNSVRALAEAVDLQPTEEAVPTAENFQLLVQELRVIRRRLEADARLSDALGALFEFSRADWSERSARP